MPRVLLALTLVATVLFALPAPTFTTPGSDWRTGDLFVSVGDRTDRESRGTFVLFSSEGAPRDVSIVDRNRGNTAGCTVEPATGFLWTTSGDGNSLSAFEDVLGADGEYPLLQTVNLRGFTFRNARARGAVGSVLVDANGRLLAGTSDGANLLLVLAPDGTVIDSFEMAGGIASFDLAADQHTVYYTSPLDSVVRRYDLATRQPMPDFARLVDGSLHALRLLPNDQGLLVAGSVGITRLATSGAFLTRYWVPETQFFALSIAPDGRTFWTSNMTGQLLRFDLASEKLIAGPIDSGFAKIQGLCAKDEYLAATDVCRTTGADGQEMSVKCPAIETCGNLTDDDGDGLADAADADCQVPGLLHELPPMSLVTATTGTAE
jgi:hypothetical protein